jgi:acetyl esterase
VALARAEHRASTAVVARPVESDVVVTEHTVPAAYGFLEVREYRAGASGPLPPAVVFLHGGGWVTGTLDTYDDLCSRLAEAMAGAVFSVDYRLAPEVSYPGPVDDAEIAVRWLLDGARELAVDPSRVWVAGDSAGGTLAAAAARRLRDRPLPDGPSLAGQLLWYPVTDARMDTGSFTEFADGFGLTAAQMSWFWDLYCPELERRSEPDASPLRADDLSGLPPLFLTLASHDPLRDEGLAYGARLEEAGVHVQVTVAPGMVHGFLRWTAILDEPAQYLHEAAQRVRTAGSVRTGRHENDVIRSTSE